MNDTSPINARATRHRYTSGSLVRFGEAAELTLGGPGCQADCHGQSRPLEMLR